MAVELVKQIELGFLWFFGSKSYLSRVLKREINCELFVTQKASMVTIK